MNLIHVMTVPQSLIFLAGQTGYMRAMGFCPIAVSSPGDALERFAESENIQAHDVAMPRRISPLRDLVALARLWRVMRRVRPTIVHSHTPKGGLLGMIAAWLAKVPVRIYHIHGLPMMTKSGWRYALLHWAERISCLLSHQVLCVSPSVRDLAVESGLCPARKIRVLGRGTINGVEAANRFNPERVRRDTGGHVRRTLEIPRDAPTLGFVGRIVRDKGVPELVAAWRRLRARFPSLHLLIAGEFEPQDPVGAEVERALREDDRIHLMGNVEDTPSLYAAMDVVVLPTYREGFPCVPLEAAAMEVPVVATRVPGCVDAVVDGVTGTLVPVHDAGALAGAVERYLLDPELGLRHGRAGRRRVLRDFRPEVVWEAVYREYVRLLQEKGVTVPEPSAAPSVEKTAA